MATRIVGPVTDVSTLLSRLVPVVFALVVGAVAVSGEGPSPLAATGAVQPAGIDALARVVVETPRVEAGDISPDGSSVLYTVRRDSAVKNETTAELVVQRIRLVEGAGDEVPVTIATALGGEHAYLFSARWCPDSTCVTFKAQQVRAGGEGGPGPLMRYDLHTRNLAPIPLQDTRSAGPGQTGDRPRITVIGDSYRWAPSGKLLAFTAPIEIVKNVKPTIGVRVGPDLTDNPALLIPTRRPKVGLFLLDVATGHVQQLTPNTLSVKGFDWAPDSEAVAVAATSEGASRDEFIPDDIFVVDRRTGAVRDVVKQRGIEANPRFSPDGRWLAVLSTFGKLQTLSQVGVVSVAGGPLKGPASGDAMDIVPIGGEVRWTSDSRSFYYVTNSRMSKQLRRMTVEGVTSVPVIIAEDAYAVDSPNVSPDGRSVAFVRSAPNVPPQLCIRALPDGPTRQVTRLSADFPLTSQVRAERIQWPSRDGSVTLHGLLLTPRSDDAAPAMRSAGKAKGLPTIVYVVGGPSMVTASFDQAHAHILALAAHGYAVFIPNTRGRSLGYGTAYGFPDGFPDALAYARIPYEDIMAGLDALVSRGVAHPERLGILGHSYGGYITSFSVTQTHRFRAAVNYEGTSARLMANSLDILPGTTSEGFNRAKGVRNAFAPDDRDKLFAVSPAFNMHCVATPMMLIYGTTRTKDGNARALFSGLLRFGIPADMILFDDGHVVSVPTAKVDLAKRLAGWFDYWLREVPYPEPALGAKYDAWRMTSGSKRSTPPSCAAQSGSH